MTREDRQLLFTDLCGRLPYGVHAQYYDKARKEITEDAIDGVYTYPCVEIVLGEYSLELEDIKPYLRPMSSMTKEEYNELEELIRTEDSNLNLSEITARITIDWLNKKMFDYRGLIPKNQAISTEIYNPYI